MIFFLDELGAPSRLIVMSGLNLGVCLREVSLGELFEDVVDFGAVLSTISCCYPFDVTVSPLELPSCSTAERLPAARESEPSWIRERAKTSS